jgi:hypothetical protein
VQDFQLPHDQCPERFVCDVPSGDADLAQFSTCIVSIFCVKT